MRHTRIRELCKTVAMVLLLLSVAILTLTAVYLSGSAGTPALANLALRLSGEPAPPPLQDQAPLLTDAAQPLLISVCNDTGRASFWRDFTTLDSVYEALGSRLAAALDTAATPEETTLTAFCAAAAKPGVYFLFPGELPLSVLAAWLDADAEELNLSGQRFLLTASGGDTICLYVGGEGGFWKLDTQVGTADLAETLAGYPSDGTRLAMECDEPAFQALDPLSLVDLSVTDAAAATWSNPCDDAFFRETAIALGFNPYGDSTYRDDAGNTIYTETDCSLRISADGTLDLKNQDTGRRFAATSAEAGDQIEYVRSLIQSLAGDRLGDARLYVNGIRRDGELTTVEFCYLLSGLEILRSDGPAVKAVFRGAVLTEWTFRIRTYTLNPAERQQLLPAAQAAAVLPEGSRLKLVYSDTGEAELEAGWLR